MDVETGVCGGRYGMSWQHTEITLEKHCFIFPETYAAC